MRRKQDTEPNKLYYDISIEYDPNKSDNWIIPCSKAEKTIDLKDPLIENPGDYNLSVSKFKIDTENIPIMIPEIENNYNKDYNGENVKYTTDYIIKMKIEGKKYTGTEDDKKAGLEEKNGKSLYNEDFSCEVITKVNFFLNNYLKPRESFKGKGNSFFINNLDPVFYIYDYKDFLSAISDSINVISDFDKKIPNFCNGSKSFFFELENDKIRFFIHGSLFEKKNKFNYEITKVVFGLSKNLYKYLGNGFPVYYFYEENDYDFFQYKIDRYATYYDQLPGKNYYYMEQSYSTLSNWHCLKAIIIGSDTLPITPEFLPIAQTDGFLVHYDTPKYRNDLDKLGIKQIEQNRNIFNQNSQMILDIYYPLSSMGGDIRSSVIHTRDDIDQGQNIELLPSSPLTRFNIWVKWLDNFGNLHDLYLNRGCSADIRLCFTKKIALKEDLAEGFESVLESLPEKKSKKEKKKSNGKNDGIVLEGADRCGFIHL